MTNTSYDRTKGIAQIRDEVKCKAVQTLNLENVIRVGNDKYLIPVDHNGALHFVEVKLTYTPYTETDVERLTEKYTRNRNATFAYVEREASL